MAVAVAVDYILSLSHNLAVIECILCFTEVKAPIQNQLILDTDDTELENEMSLGMRTGSPVLSSLFSAVFHWRDCVDSTETVHLADLQ